MKHNMRPPKGGPGGRPMAKKGTMKRLVKMLFSFYPVMLPTAIFCVIFNAVVSSVPSLFMQNVISVIEKYWSVGDWDSAKPEILSIVGVLVIFYILSLKKTIIIQSIYFFNKLNIFFSY